MRIAACVVTCLCLAVICVGQPLVEAARAAAAPAIDGVLDDACWQTAKPMTSFVINNTDTPATYGSTVRVAYDDSALYIGVRCDEPDVASIVTQPLPRDHGDVFRTDCVEIMIDPEQSKNTYYHIGVNASGSVSDRACTQGGYIGDWTWDAQMDATSAIGDGFWACEMAIPFYTLGISSKVGQTWGLNVCREKKKPAEDSAIGEQGAFNIATRFAQLTGMQADFSRYRYEIAPVQTSTKIAEGALDLTITVPIANQTGAGEERLLDGWLIGPDGTVTTAATPISPAAGTQADVDLGPIRLTQQGEYTCYVRVADPITKKPLALRKTSLSIEYVPLTIRLIEPWYRNAIFATQKLEQVVLDVNVSLDASAGAAGSLRVAIADAAGGEVLAETTVEKVQESNRVTFPAGGLPESRMRIVATLRDADGKAVAETSHPLRKLPALDGEVWLDRDMQWRVDGQPFFLNGAWNYAEDFCEFYNAFSGRDTGAKWLDAGIMNDLHYKTRSVRTEALSPEDAQYIRDYAAARRDDGQLFAYFVSDEPEVGNIKAAVLEDVYDILADEDPYHPVIISNDSMHGLQAYARCGDINGLHPYPVILRDYEVNDFDEVAAYVEGAVGFFRDAPHKQTVAYLHQGFNYGDYGAVNNRIPTYVEYRNQDLLALICGARGTIQFNRMVAHYPELYIGMPRLTQELAYLGPIMLAPTPDATPTADCDGVKMLLKEHEGNLYLLACNASMEPREIAITVPGIVAQGGKLRVVPEAREVTLQEETVRDQFGPWEVHVYTTASAPDLPSVADVVAEITAANEARRKAGNLAYQEFEGDGVVVSASSSKAAGSRRPDTGLWHVVDGIVDQSDRYHCLTWQDATDDEFPDWLEIKLPQPQSIGRIIVYPFENSLRDYSVQAFVGDDWQTLSSVEGQNTDTITHEFAPVTTDRIRIAVAAANGKNSMVTEVEVYAK